MKISNLNLVNEEGASVKNTSVELSNMEDARKYFGSGIKVDASFRDVAKWCKEQIKLYKRYIQNLETVMVSTKLIMNEGMSNDEFLAFVAQNGKLAKVVA